MRSTSFPNGPVLCSSTGEDTLRVGFETSAVIGQKISRCSKLREVRSSIELEQAWALELSKFSRPCQIHFYSLLDHQGHLRDKNDWGHDNVSDSGVRAKIGMRRYLFGLQRRWGKTQTQQERDT